VGVNVNSNWQEPEAAAGSELPHEFLEMENGPVMALVKGTTDEVLLATVTCNGVDVLPCSQLPKLIVAGVRLIAPEEAPVPLSETVSSPPVMLALMVKRPVRLPS
jgi:hypothetical protein